MVGRRRRPDTASCAKRAALVCALLVSASACKAPAPDPEAAERFAFVERLAFQEDAGALWRLTSNDTIFFDEGWYPLEKPAGEEHPAEAWRWMGKRGVIRIRKRREAQTVTLTGWVPLNLLGAPPTLTYRWLGLIRYAEIATAGRFTREIVLPGTDQAGEWGDLLLETSHAATDRNDPRELGFALTSIILTSAP